MAVKCKCINICTCICSPCSPFLPWPMLCEINYSKHFLKSLAFRSVSFIGIGTHFYLWYNSCSKFQAGLIRGTCMLPCVTHAGSTHHTVLTPVLHVMSHQCLFYMSCHFSFCSARHVTPVLVLHVMTLQCWLYTSYHIWIWIWWFYTSCHTNHVMVVLHVMSHQCLFNMSYHPNACSTRHASPMLVPHVMSHEFWFYSSCHSNAGSTCHITYSFYTSRLTNAGSTCHVTRMQVLHVMSHLCWFNMPCQASSKSMCYSQRFNTSSSHHITNTGWV